MSEKAVPEELKNIVYKPAPLQWLRYDTHCTHRIWGSFEWYQCSRKPKHTIHGFGFCTQHAQMVRKRLEEK